MRNAPKFLCSNNLQLLLFGGKGGVGKTTCATATALTLAKDDPDQSILLFSTDPAHSLLDSLRTETPPENLTIEEFDAEGQLEDYKLRHQPIFQEIARRGTFLDNRDIQRFFDLSLPGLDELMALLAISSRLQEKKYRTLIVDTAPTGHTLKLLAVPTLITQWLYAIDALLGKHRYMKQVFHGSYTPDDIDQFLLDLQQDIQSLNQLLTDSERTQFVTVMIPEPFCLDETRNLLSALETRHITCQDIVINQCYPWHECSICLQTYAAQQPILTKLTAHLPGYQYWTLPLQTAEIHGIDKLSHVWQQVIPLHQWLAEQQRPNPQYQPTPPRVVSAMQPLPASIELVILAGKGGVGKTTLASAMAMQLAQQYPEKKLLLFSSDPAHSLAICLDQPIGDAPVRVDAGLYAMEIDGQREFDQLKQTYEAELQQFLENVSTHLDFTFDREVMERLMDLSPPGLDELMVVMRASEFLIKGQFDLLILDAAPTGHLLRLLEMPALITQWLRLFFDIFLKYKQMFQLPGVVDTMIAMSKQLKRFISLLQDAEKARLFAVTIPTEMAFSETQDLLNQGDRLGFSCGGILLNRVTPDSECVLCHTRFSEESHKITAFSSVYPDIQRTTIYRGLLPQGTEKLKHLGMALFAE